MYSIDSFFPLTGGCSKGLGAFWFFFEHVHTGWSSANISESELEVSEDINVMPIDQRGQKFKYQIVFLATTAAVLLQTRRQVVCDTWENGTCEPLD